MKHTTAFVYTMCLLAVIPDHGHAATCTWTGGWDVVPSTIDDVIVVSSGGNLVWSNTYPRTVASWTQAVSYSGTATFTTVYQAAGFTNFTISGDALIAGGAWTHLGNVNGETNRLCVTVGGNLLLTNAAIIADGLGYGAGYGPGSRIGACGAAYGGTSLEPGTSAVNTNTYGSIIAPTNLGSGSTSTFGVSGGGAILLTVAGTTTVASAGVISINGSYSANRGGGSGGSLYLATGWLTGSGSLRANGGTAVGGDGGGGRVAIILTGPGSDFSLWSGSNTAYGGGTADAGAAGTVYRKTQAGVDTLIIDNNGAAAIGQVSTLMPNGVNLNVFSSVVITNKGSLGVRGDTTLDFNTVNLLSYGSAKSAIAIDNDSNVTYPADWVIDGYTLYVNTITPNKPVNMTIGNNGVLSHYKNQNLEAYKVNLTISGNLAILSNGTITADGLGYMDGYGPGSGQGNGGAAYGGEARDTSLVLNTNTYGSIMAPTNLGSGSVTTFGVSGGGAILLTVAGTTAVAAAGVISVNGSYSASRGGGSGGSLYLTTGWLTGNGTLRANGGTAAGGDGGGGRVAIILTGAGADFTLWTGTNTAFGGATADAGAAGTVYRKAAAAASGAGTVIVSNSVTATPLTAVPARLNPGENLKGSAWLVTGYGKLGVTTNVQLGYLTVTGANSRVNLQGRAVSVLPDLNINGTLYGVGLYTTNQLGAAITDSLGVGSIEVRPIVDNAGGATNVTQTNAGLNGNLYAADSSAALFVLWGARDAGTNVGQWAHTNVWAAPVTPGYFSATVTAPDLQANTVYYYRFYTTNNAVQNLASASSVFMTTDVTVQPTVNAAEAGLVPGTFTFYRDPAATNGAITVPYSIGGSARPGTNYVNNLGASITFAEGVSQTNLTFTPLLDDNSLINETIILTLANGPYHLGVPSVATGIVVDAGIPGAPTNAWIGTGNANQASNWSLGHPPSDSEYVLLSGFSKAALVWNVTNAVMAWRQTGQYTGTVTMATVYGATGFTNFTVNGDVTLLGGVWTHPANTTTETNRLHVTVGGNFFMSNTTINADALGYMEGYGPGSIPGVFGAAHGGAAPDAGASILVNSNTYGSIIAPTNLGSGSTGTFGVRGGGAIRMMVAGTTTVATASMISANGANASTRGGGSGGSLYLTTGWLTGSGLLRANGGNGAAGNFSGGGGGGRVAIVLTGAGADFNSWFGTNTAYGGTVWNAGAAGTVYRKTADVPVGGGTVIVDNGGVATNMAFTSLPAGANSHENLDSTQWVLRNKARLGLLQNGAIWSLTMGSNSYVALAGKTLNVHSLMVTNRNYTTGIYTPAEIGFLSDGVGGGMIFVSDRAGTVFSLR